MRAAVIGGDAAAIGGLLAAGTHAFPTVVNILAGLLGCVWFGIQIWDRFATRRSSYTPPANQAVRDWHRDYDGPNLP
jgi:hypothetical protein